MRVDDDRLEIGVEIVRALGRTSHDQEARGRGHGRAYFIGNFENLGAFEGLLGEEDFDVVDEPPPVGLGQDGPKVHGPHDRGELVAGEVSLHDLLSTASLPEPQRSPRARAYS
jgi:hypothetical protein